MDPQHLYLKLPLFGTGMVLAVWLIATHLMMILKPAASQRFLREFPRNQVWGCVLLGIGLGWFWLLMLPPGDGTLRALSMDLGEFNGVKPKLLLVVPVVYVLVCLSVRDFLAVRALGVVGLMAAAPLLGSAMFKEPSSRLLLVGYVYAMLTASMFCVGMPYLFRDAVTWATASLARWRGLAVAGLAYGVLVAVCAVMFWKGC